MLTYLGVKGFAIIDELKIEFGEGFNVITGETGAGKSIVINALATLMNSKAAPDTVRSSAVQAEVTGHFINGDDEYIIKRVVGSSGRSRAFLNNDPITLVRMETLGCKLISVYGQNEFQHLLDKENYAGIIDGLLGLNGEQMKLSVKVDELKRVTSELSAKKREAEGRQREIDLLEFQIDEIEKKDVREGEEEGIKERLKTLRSSEKISGIFDEMTEGIEGWEQSPRSLLKRYSSMLKALGSIEMLDGLKKKVDEISFELEDLLLEVRSLGKELFFDPEEMQKLEERLSDIFRLKDKYGKTCEDIRLFYEKARKRLDYLKGLEENIDELEKERNVLEGETKDLSELLSKQRREGAPGIEKTIVEELRYLSMDGIQFRVGITERGYIDREGQDDIELLISTNPGEPLKPLRKIASGGELSRIMLAIKKVIGGEEEKVLIFDEVDAGIGGKVADLVGRRLRDLSRKQQVLCITHLPQIAAYGDRHFLVEKQVKDGRTRTNIRELSEEERIGEIARMLGGVTITDATIKRAQEMLAI